MKSAIFASLLATAAAFAPAQQKASSSALAAFADEVGSTAPLGAFDPLGLVADGNQAQFDRLRYVELKHGRVAMLAVVGYLTTAAGVRLPGYEDAGYGFDALATMPLNAWLHVAFTVGLLEAAMRDATGEAEFAGDFRNGFDFGWDSQSDAWKKNKRNIEINQGRAAQMGIMGLMVHDQLGNIGEIVPALK